MMKYRTLKFRMILLFLTISIPSLILLILSSQINLQNNQEQIISTKQNSINILVKQFDVGLEAVGNYIQLILYEKNDYSALQFSEQNTRYQQARIWLKDELYSVLDHYPLITCFYVNIPNTKDAYIINKSNQMTLDTKEYLKEVLQGGKYLEQDMLEYEGEKYLIQTFGNTYMEIGYVISISAIRDEVSGSFESDERISLMTGEGEEAYISEGNRRNTGYTGNYITLVEEFTVINAKIKLELPNPSRNQNISVRDRAIWYCTFALLILLPVFLVVLGKFLLFP